VITLLSDRFAPITSAIGFLELPLEEAGKGLLAWREQLHGRAKATQLGGSLPEMLERLPPLTGGVRPRELLVGTVGDRWTAYFDCGFQGGDPVSAVGYLSRTLQCQGVVVVSVPHTVGTPLESPGRHGGVQFELYGPLRTDFLNYVRTVSVTHDGSKWRFDANGTVQAFEQESQYKARKIRDRFTTDMLASYAAELGLHPFDDSFYTEMGLLIESPLKPPKEAKVMSLADTQRFWGIVPGVVDQLPG
jgi:hypothetical protein